MNVTIITPVHGTYEKYGNMIKEIGEKLDEQTKQPHEWLVVCDEKSKWVNDIKLPKFSKILVAEKNNISIKRNMALDNMSGDYTFLLDSDQMPKSKELLFECIQKCSKDFDLLRIPEEFSNTGSYLKRSYHHLRALYWAK